MRQTCLPLLLACLAAASCSPPKVPPPAKKAGAPPQETAAKPDAKDAAKRPAGKSAVPAKSAAAKPTASKLAAKPFVLPAVELTPQQVADGWINLFDGSSLFGWNASSGTNWTVRDGAIAAPASGWLLTHQPFTDFRLRLQFRTTGAASAVLALRARPDGDPTQSGFLVDPAKLNAKPGDWHAYDILARGSDYIVLLDGRQLLRTRRFSPQAGALALSAGAIEYRAIQLRPLDMACMFNGTNLDGWRRVERSPAPPQPAEWTVRDGAIHVEKGPGQLESQYAFDDFIFQADIRANSTNPSLHPNSGVFFRGDRDIFWSGYEVQVRNEFTAGDTSKSVDFGTGGLYHRQPARRIAARDNEWFTMTVSASGRRISVWIDGVPVTSYRDAGAEGLNVRDGKARLLRGSISLQAHDPTTNLDFRSLCIAPMARLSEK
ncbi:3-keto-disaccharide hydrolase [Paludibaculum fermentans]|uniref:3-keto-disaccharide hydrolase n=1 Tax=Paludibaculum fermentans TaxID=1473598 RepID=UPI003EBAC150